MKKNNQKGAIQMVLILGIVAVSIFIGYLLYLQNVQKKSVSVVPSPYQAQYQQAGQAVAPIEDTGGLDSVAASLDTTNINQLDAELNALNTSSKGF